MRPEEAAAQTLDLASAPTGAFIKDGTVTDVLDTTATVAVDGGGEARPAILGYIPSVGDRVTMLFDPAANGTCVILGTLGGIDPAPDLGLLPIVAPADDDYLALTDTSDADSSARSLASDVLDLIDTAAILALVYPVGCIYFSTNSTNPATSLGFGTWTAFGAGRVPVGFDSGNTAFDTDEETGGAQTVTLALSEIPAHDHGSAGAHTHTLTGTWDKVTIGTGARATSTGTRITETAAPPTSSDGTHTHNSNGSGGAHNNLQPYIVVRMWKRTA